MVWALSGVDTEAELLAIANTGGIVVRRRCFDAPELLAVSAVVPGTHVLISAQLPRMSSEIMATLKTQVTSVAVIAFDEREELIARSWNPDRVMRGDHVDFDLVARLRQDHPVEREEQEQSCHRGVAAAKVGAVSACWGPVGSHGRTTFAIGLAEALGNNGARVLLIDADTVAPSVSLTLGIEEDVSGIVVAARYAEQNALDSRALANCARAINPNFWVMTGLSDPRRWPEVRAGAMRKIIERAREHFDHIVIDLGAGMDDTDGDEGIDLAPTLVPRRTLVTSTVLDTADQVYLIARADALGAQRLASVYSSHAQIFASARRCAVVNMVHNADSRSVQREFGAICGALDPDLEVRYLPNDSAAAEMVKKASTLGEIGSRGSLARAIKVCADARLRRREYEHPVANFSPLVKFLSIFRGHANATAGSNG
jgi:MinD-like ATPase involved in chromosome partitioning or flagellar assembly